MRFDATEAMALADELSPPRRAGTAETARVVARLGELLRDAGYHVREFLMPGVTELSRPPWGFALAAATAGIVLEVSQLSGRPSGPKELALACAVLVVVGLIERRIQQGNWGGSKSVSIRATDPRVDPAPARLVLVSALETPAPPATERLWVAVTVLQVLWLALLWIPCILGDARAWLTDTGPELLQMLAVLALVPGLDSWTRRPSSYPGDNRSGPALAVAIARAWPPSLADRVALEVRLEPPDDFRPGRDQGTAPRTLVVVLKAPGVGSQLVVEGTGPVAELAATAARELWLPVATVARNQGPLTVVIGASGPLATDGRPDPKLLQATAQLLEELALRWARAGEAR